MLVVPLFRKYNLGAILGYLFAGILIGPHLSGLIKDPQVILHFSELGVVFLLFIIGLELAPAKLWKMRSSIFGLGLAQVVLTGSLFTLIGTLLGLELSVSIIAGFGLALSSTAFGIQILEENRQLKTTHGQGSFSILMFQDLAVVPLLAVVSLFAPETDTSFSWFNFFRAVAVIALLIFIGHYLIRHILRLIANTRTQEVFTSLTLFIVIGTAVLMESIGLSMGMGAFLAGVLLADSEYRHELETNLLPFKGLLLGLFFIAVGMSLELQILMDKPHWILGLTIALLSLKGTIIYALGRAFRFPKESSRNMAFTLPQGGEFAFVLFSTAIANGILDQQTASILNASVTLSMACTPFLFRFNQKKLRSYSELSEKPYDVSSDDEAKVIIAGFGRFGQIISRVLKSQNVTYTILEHSASQVETARKYGSKIFYGDASREDILEAAGAKAAKTFVLAIDDPMKSVETAKLIKEKFPHLNIIARARNREHALDLMELGVENIHRETLLTSLEVAKEVLLSEGFERQKINGKLAKFRSVDEQTLLKQFELRDNETQFVSFTRKAAEELDTILREDQKKDQIKS